MKSILIFIAVMCLLSCTQGVSEDLIYGYECQKGKCVKVELNEQNFDKAICLPVCHMLCFDTIGTIWPQPTGPVQLAPLLLHIDITRINYEVVPESSENRVSKLWRSVEARFEDHLKKKIPDQELLKSGGHALNIKINLTNSNKDALKSLPRLMLETDESYRLNVSSTEGDTVTAILTADNFFGARHALETLNQIIVYDDIRREVQMLGKVELSDAPAYKWRGILVDTSRSFYSVDAIKRTLDAMAMVKLNTFHWHITDSHSFPLELKTEPELYKLGAYSPRKVYSQSDIGQILEYGLTRGIRIMPEFDAPAHVGEGWQHKNMTACFRAQPWTDYCVEPPCGQLDPTIDALYDVLGNIYSEISQLFQPDVFHMGGDEVSIRCWNASTSLREGMIKRGLSLNEEGYMRLWDEFQKRALERFDRTYDNIEKIPIVLWTSTLTQVPHIDNYLDKQRYIIQVWTEGSDPMVQKILKRGFRTIMSNYDALYFDCGNAGWVNDSENWCSPYKGWQKIYSNNLQNIAGDYNSLVLGAEAAIWSEQIDEQNMDARIWPRASALAERLWSHPAGTWKEAEARMLLHRQRLVDNGIGAEQLQPEWCLQNEGECPIDAYAKNT